MKKSKPKKISQNRLKRVFKDIREQNSKEIRFCFVIGAGASKSSGIKTGWELSEEWYKELKEDLDAEELQAWKDNISGDFDEDNIGAYYSDLYKARYEVEPETGYNTLTALMEKAEPGIGYTILAHILTQERHNFVITTNFDYLIEDSIRMFTSKKPLVAGHETLAEFVSSQAERPTIIKVHRDLLLHPFNNGEETGTLKEEWKKTLAPILKNFRLIVLGYGGNDGSLMDYLSEMDVTQRKPIYWCVRDPKKDINHKIDNLLTDKDFIVPIQGFDEFMIVLYDVLKYDFFNNLNTPEEHVFVKSAHERIVKLNSQRNRLLESGKDKQNMPQEAKSLFKNAWEYLYKAYREEDMGKKNTIYQDGLQAYPRNAELLGAYAAFLHDTGKDYGQAEEYYKRAIEIDSKYANNLGNYAAFLHDIRKDYDQAEEYYKRAIEFDPRDANNLGNYAWFLHDIRKDYDQAEEYYKRVIEFDPRSASNLGNYAAFLHDIRKDYDQAEKYYIRSVEANPRNARNLGNYAWFLYDIRKDYGQAEEYYKLAIELDPRDASNLGNYAIFLHVIQKDNDQAEEYYKRSIEINPKNANVYVGIGFLYLQQGRLKSAEEMTLVSVKLGSLGLGNMGLGHVYFAKGNTEKAFQTYKTGLDNFQNTTEFFEWYDEDYQYLKQYNITQEAYAKMRQRLKTEQGN